jgi:glycosyltransferase involved in cell wall biosynthesis
MSRVLWISNAPWTGSGYGEQTEMFTRRFKELGHDVAIAANHGLDNRATNWHGIEVYPAKDEPAIETFAKHHRADVVITLYDAWVLHPDAWPDVRMAIWAPVDHWPIPPEVLAVLQHERVTPIAMSRFGESWMLKFGLTPLYVPHGVETSVFQPVPGWRETVRKMLEIPEDAFLVGMVAANAGWNPVAARKSFPQAFDAFGRFLKQHPDAYLYVHSRMNPGGKGQDLARLAKIMEIPEERIRTPQANAWHLGIMDSAFVAGLYNSFDVLLNPSMGEGFGVPILEAQACGVPVITCDHSAMTELTHAGWMAQGDRWWDELQCSFGIMPRIESIVECLEHAYEHRDNYELREAAVKFAQGYDADVVTEKFWKPVLRKLAEPVKVAPLSNGKEESRQVRRARERAEAKQ